MPLRSAWGRDLASVLCYRAVAGAGAATHVPWAQPCCEEPGTLAWSSDGLDARLGPLLLIKIIIQLNVLLLLQASSFLLPCWAVQKRLGGMKTGTGSLSGCEKCGYWNWGRIKGLS